MENISKNCRGPVRPNPIIAIRSKRLISPCHGFTLLEILVAMAMLSLVCISMASSGGRAVDNAGYLKERTLATWVAMNKAAEFKLAKKWIPTSTDDGESEMAGRKWQWTVTGYETPDKDIRRGVIEVRKETDDKEFVSSLTVFFGRPTGL